MIVCTCIYMLTIQLRGKNFGGILTRNSYMVFWMHGFHSWQKQAVESCAIVSQLVCQLELSSWCQCFSALLDRHLAPLDGQQRRISLTCQTKAKAIPFKDADTGIPLWTTGVQADTGPQSLTSQMSNYMEHVLSMGTTILCFVNHWSFVIIHGNELRQLHLITGAPHGINPW